MAERGARSRIVFDCDDPLGQSTCVACGECVQACPTGALMPAALVDAAGVGHLRVDREVDSVCPYCGVGCQLTYKIRDDEILYVEGRNGPANEGRLCVKGRFGFDYVRHPDRLTRPLIRRDAAKPLDPEIDPGAPGSHFRQATWEEALDVAARGLREASGSRRPARAGGLRLGEVLQRGGLPVPEAGSHRLWQQQRRPLHPPVSCLVGGRAAGGDRLRSRDGALHRRAKRRRHHRHRLQLEREPPGRRELLQERGQARHDPDRRRSARAGAPAPRPLRAATPAGNGRRPAERDHERHRHGRAVRRGVHREADRELRGDAGSPDRLLAGADGRDLRNRSGPDPGRRADLRHGRCGHDLLGHGRIPARPRHRQRALPDRPGADVRPAGPPRYGPPPPARPEQRAGRFRRRPDPDDAPRLPPGGAGRSARALRGAVADVARSRARTHGGGDPGRGSRRADQGHAHHGREPGDVGPRRPPRPRGAGEPRTSGGAGHLPDRDRRLRRCRAAGLRLAREGRHA